MAKRVPPQDRADASSDALAQPAEERAIQAESALRASEAKYRQLLETLHEGIWAIDQNARTTFVNPSMARMLGYAEAEMQGKHLFEFMDERGIELATENLRRRQQGIQEQHEFEFIGKDGRRVYTHLETSPLTDQEGKYEGAIAAVHDITEQKRADETLSRERQRFQQILDSFPYGIYIVDQEYRIEYVNPTLGREFGDPGSRKCYEYFHDLAEPCLWCQNDRVFKGEIVVWDWHSFKTGRDYELTDIPLPNDDGTISKLEVFHDITARKQGEEALRASEERQRAIISASPLAIITLSPDGRVQSWNQAAEQIFGWTEEEALGQILPYVAPDQMESFTELRKRVMGGESFSQIELTRQHKDGSPIEISISTAPIRDRDGHITAIMSIVADITARKGTEKALAANYALLRIAGESAKFGGWSVDLATNICTWSDVVADIHQVPRGYSPPVKEGIDFYAPEWHPKIAQVFADCAQRGIPYDEEMEIVTQGGDRVWVRTMGVAVRNEHGDIVQVQGAFQDITERKQAEEEIRKLNAELEQRVEERTRELQAAQEQLVRQERLAVVGQMASSVGHELRNPLSVISNAIYYLRLVLPEANPKVVEYLDMLHNETRTAERIVSDLLDFARVRSADREPVPIDTLVQSTLHHHPPPPGVDVLLNIEDGLPPLYVDRQQMAQVLENLVSNAYQAMPDGGRLAISASRHGAEIALTVVDTGVGIPAENLTKIFEPLFTTRAKGIGLGLAVCQNLVKANQGRIEVQSEPGHGATFTLTLPPFKERA